MMDADEDDPCDDDAKMSMRRAAVKDKEDRTKAFIEQSRAGMAEDGALANELEAAKRVYTAVAGLEPSAGERVCQWALARRNAEYCRLASVPLVGASLNQKAYREI
jgi:hypothetical protein